ncbi:transposase [Falsibacillus pallidus]|uniref:REP element-mobilizing transposase RayT n=1 Tax=Falsibacillus pallidus TaxID=493781 RepID=A0A370G7J3_9BACI|nr:transposase [Falsibacillus pallidus]RDI39180.1 REP element-mobilizing transposase RayT [Falsibacillus pallidus]
MPRRARSKSSTAIYHLIMRGVNCQSIFEDDEDRTRFLETISRFKRNNSFQLYSYCLMNNHVHLLMKEGADSISTVVQKISSSYVYFYNEKYERSGHLFQERFKSEDINNMRYFLTVLRYIHQNPLRAGLSISVFDSPWTSIHEYEKKYSFVDTEFPLSLFSSNKKKAYELFQQHMQTLTDDECLDYRIRMRLTDNDLREHMLAYGIRSGSDLQKLELTQRNTILSRLKQIEGVSIRQLARITGISKSVIHRAGTEGQVSCPSAATSTSVSTTTSNLRTASQL